MLEQQLAAEFAERLQRETEEKHLELQQDGPLSYDVAFAEIVVGYLSEAGAVSDCDLCPHEDQTGQGRCRVIAYSLPDDSTRLELVTTRYVFPGEASTLPERDLGRLTGRAAKFFDYASKGELSRFSGNIEAERAATLIRETLGRIEDVRIHVFTNGIVRSRDVESIQIAGRNIEFSVWDLERLHRATGEEVTRERIEVDFQKLLGRPIACLEMKPSPAEYQTFLLIISGETLFHLYEQFGARLFEFNVRSFLQVKGSVNKGIRETIKTNPGRFLAYNNGITATADEMDVGMFHGETAIRRLQGLQIVNGAQTTASIHRAKKFDKLDISQVAVAMKLTIVQPGKLDEFVPLVSRFANTQNPVQLADLSANNSFHVRLEQLSEQIWCPGEESRWFYERARGAYQVARSRFGTTPSKRRDFDSTCPRAQHFGKPDLAKYWMSWWLLPHIVSKGAQKNFAAFMIELWQRYPSDWQPDDLFYRQTIALALLFRAARASVRGTGIQSYGANVVTYLVAKFSADYGHDCNLELLWETQEVSPELISLFRAWAQDIHQALVDSANSRNVTEWCKKDACWDIIKDLKLTLPTQRPPEMALIVKDGTSPEAATSPEHANGSASAAADDCVSFDGPTWAKIMAWAALPGSVADFDRRVAHTISGYALQGWKQKPSDKQAAIAARVLDAARRAGVI